MSGKFFWRSSVDSGGSLISWSSGRPSRKEWSCSATPSVDQWPAGAASKHDCRTKPKSTESAVLCYCVGALAAGGAI